jgi:hypothetical protein
MGLQCGYLVGGSILVETPAACRRRMNSRQQKEGP